MNKEIKKEKYIQFPTEHEKDEYIQDNKLEKNVDYIDKGINGIELLESKDKSLNEGTDNVNTLELNTGVLPIVYTGLYGLNDELGNYEVTEEDLDDLTKEFAIPLIEETLHEILPSVKIKAKNVYHPKFYNFSDDELEFDLTYSVDEYNKLKEDAINKEEFKTFLSDNYKSYDGFISTMADDLDQFNEQDDWKQFVQVVMFYIPKETCDDNSEKFTDELLDYVWGNFELSDAGKEELGIDDSDELDESKQTESLDSIIDAAYEQGLEYFKTTIDKYSNLSMESDIVDGKIIINVNDFNNKTGETSNIGEYIFDTPNFIENKDDLKDYLLEDKPINMGEYKIYAMAQNGNEYTSELVDTVDNAEQAMDQVAELNAQGLNAYYVSTSDELSELAEYIDNFMYDYDTYGYKDIYNSRGEGFEDILKSLSSKSSIMGIVNFLQDVLEDEESEEDRDNARFLLKKVNEVKKELVESRLQESKGPDYKSSDELPKECYTYVKSTGEIGKIINGETGYRKTDISLDEYTDGKTRNQVGNKIVRQKNQDLGIDKDTQLTMELRSMFGWGKPKNEKTESIKKFESRLNKHRNILK